MVAAKQESNNSPTQSAPEEPKGDHLQSSIEPSTIPSNIDPEACASIHPQLQRTAADNDSLANAALRAATEAASIAVKDDPEGISILDQDTVTVAHNQVSVSRPQLSQSSPLDTAVLLNETNSAAAFPSKMDIHDATGTILHQFGVNGDADHVQPPHQTTDAAAQDHQTTQNQHSNQTVPGPETAQVTQAEVLQPPQQSQQASLPQQQPCCSVPQQQPSGPTSKPMLPPSQAPIATPVNPPRKTTRMPGTKQCPSCQNTIAAALAKCPKCPHVFREKKEKVKRSGKRGKKNCPKCGYENPSACSSCKNCKYVFRLKLMDKYKQMRPRQTSDSAAAAAAAAAHAAANMTGQHAGVTAVSTVPMQAGVASYPNTVAQPMHHPGHATVIPSLTQHAMSIHPHAHNVHATGVPQMHTLPQHPMPHHQSHPQL